METFASLCGRTACAVPETECCSMLRSSERRALKESILADVLNRLTHQCEVQCLFPCGAKFIKVRSLEVYEARQLPQNRARRSPMMMVAKVSLEEKRPLFLSHKGIRVMSDCSWDNANDSGLRSRISQNKHSIIQLFSLREPVTVINFQMLHYVPGQI